jgi:DNA-binding transcriptional MocR family regulator
MRHAGGRPRAKIDLVDLEKLCAMQCTQRELAAYFKVSLATFERHAQQPKVRELIERGRLQGMISVRRRQFQLMEAGDRTMCIWLGKQVLGQRDQIDSRLSNPDGSPLISLAQWRELVKAAKKEDGGTDE